MIDNGRDHTYIPVSETEGIKMIRLIAAVIFAIALAGCSTTRPEVLNVATGVDANGAVIWQQQEIYTRPKIMDTPTGSISDGPCWNAACN